MIEKPKDHIDWSLTTWKGSRLKQHRDFYILPFSQKLQLIEEMTELTDLFKNTPTKSLNEDVSGYPHRDLSK